MLDSFGCSHSIGLSIIHLPVICQLSVCLSIYLSIHPSILYLSFLSESDMQPG